MESLVKAGKGGTEILGILRDCRERAGLAGPSSSVVHRFVHGDTFQRDVVETRGRPPKVTSKVLNIVDKERKKLIKAADNKYTVTWDDICAASKKPLRKAKVLGAKKPMWSADWLAKRMRSEPRP